MGAALALRAAVWAVLLPLVRGLVEPEASEPEVLRGWRRVFLPRSGARAEPAGVVARPVLERTAHGFASPKRLLAGASIFALWAQQARPALIRPWGVNEANTLEPRRSCEPCSEDGRQNRQRSFSASSDQRGFWLAPKARDSFPWIASTTSVNPKRRPAAIERSNLQPEVVGEDGNIILSFGVQSKTILWLLGCSSNNLWMSASVGVLHAYPIGYPDLKKYYCVAYNRNWTQLPTSVSFTDYKELVFLMSKYLCHSSEVTADIKDKIVVVKRGNCSFLEKGDVAQRLGAKLLLVASEPPILPPGGNKTHKITIQIVVIENKDAIDLAKTHWQYVKAAVYLPLPPILDLSMVVLFLISVFCVTVGGYWSGQSEVMKLQEGSSPGSRDSLSGEEALILSPIIVVLFVFSCCIMLVLLYYFYTWLVYVVISIFCMASASATYACLSALLKNIPYGEFSFTCRGSTVPVKFIFLALCCMSLSISWVMFRKQEKWVWILQDFLGICFCLSFLRALKMPNFKLCVVFLMLLLIYDIFFVFVTPFLTESGESIMVEVATGPAENSEPLPVVFKVPRLAFSVVSLCLVRFSLLGFGDIVVPGLLVAYCCRFDVRTNSSYIYFTCCVLAYTVGMLIAFLSLMLMKKAQPALLYLVPCTLITCTVVALYREEMKKFWNGSMYQVMDTATEEGSNTQANEEEGSTTQANEEEGSTTQANKQEGTTAQANKQGK